MGSPKLQQDAATLSPQDGERIIAVVNQKPVWGTGRGLNLNDPGGSPSFPSTIVVQLGPRIIGIHSSSFPPDFSELSLDFSRVFFHVDMMFTFFPAAIIIPGSLAASDESA